MGFAYKSQLIEDNFRFVTGTTNETASNYSIPSTGQNELTDSIEFIRNLPLNDPPEIFGLHPNAEITYARNQTQDTLGTTLTLEGGSGSGGGGGADDLVDELAADILSKLPEQFDVEAAEIAYPVTYSESMNTVLCQELVRFNKLTKVVKKSLQDIRKAVKGLVVMSSDLEDVAIAMAKGRVPGVWAGVAYPSLKPLGSWVSDLVARLNFFSTWIDNDHRPHFGFLDFFFTQSFLTGTLQNFARRNFIPIDMLIFDFEVQVVESFSKAPEDGCYIHGLFIEGAKWDAEESSVSESDPKVLLTSIPIIWLKPTENLNPSVTASYYEPREGQYPCPLFRTQARRGTLSTTGHSTNFVMTIYLPTKKVLIIGYNVGLQCYVRRLTKIKLFLNGKN